MSLAVALLAGCAGQRIEGGVFRSPKGYHVRLPGADWTVVDKSRADLQLQHREGAAGILANATCTGGAGRPSDRVLLRQLTAGLRERTVLERHEVSLDGRVGTRTVLEAAGADGRRVRVETYLLTDARCVYDLIYAAPVEDFEARHGDFERFIETFATE